MKVLILNTILSEVGGASRFCMRLHRKFQERNIDSKILVKKDLIGLSKNDESIEVVRSKVVKLRTIFNSKIELSYQRKYSNNNPVDFRASWLKNGIASYINTLNPDVVHFNWVSEGFIPASEIVSIKAPIVWKMPDAWGYTGGCYITGDCKRYQIGCGKCPRLGSLDEDDLSAMFYRIRKTAYSKKQIQFVTPSSWLAREAELSGLLKGHIVKVINNGIDTNIFCPRNKIEAKRSLGIDPKRKVILFIASHADTDLNKGWDLLQLALRIVDEKLSQKVNLVVVGNENPINIKYRNIEIIAKGVLKNENDIINCYNSADVTVVPSRSESLSNTVLESLTCGTPAVAFNIGGIPDMINDGVNGYLVPPYNTNVMGGRILSILEGKVTIYDNNEVSRFRKEFSIENTVEKYVELYENVMKGVYARK